jgi:hypothetical protein
LSVTNHLDGHGCPWRRSAHHGDELVTGGDIVVVVFHDDVSRLEAGRCRRAAAFHLSHQRASRLLQSQWRCDVLRHWCDLHADAAARDLPLPQLREQFTDRVDRNRKPDADVAGDRPAGEDRRVDADHFAAQVQQGPSRVAGVDRGVGLQDVLPAALGYRKWSADRANHAHGDRVREIERIADRHGPVAWSGGVRAAQHGDRQVVPGLLGELD